MTNAEFREWAARNGMDSHSINALVDCAATQAETQSAIDAMEEGPPIYNLASICDLHDSNGFGASPGKHGFIFIGYCPNGDQIAIDVAVDKGSIWYINHERMHSPPMRQNAIRVGDDLRSVYHSIMTDRDFPIDYYAAKEKYEN